MTAFFFFGNWNLQTDEMFWIDGGHKRVFGYPIENALIHYHSGKAAYTLKMRGG